MSNAVESFFTGLADAGHVATFEREFATIRFDVLDSGEEQQPEHSDRVERWYVTIADGTVSGTRQDRPTDAIVRISRPLLEAVVTGQANAQAAFLRGRLTVEGKVAALILFQRYLPGPPGSTGRVAPITSSAVMAQKRDT